MWDAVGLVGTEGLDGRHGSLLLASLSFPSFFMESVSLFSVAVDGPILLFFPLVDFTFISGVFPYSDYGASSHSY